MKMFLHHRRETDLGAGGQEKDGARPPPPPPAAGRVAGSDPSTGGLRRTLPAGQWRDSSAFCYPYSGWFHSGLNSTQSRETG